MSANLKPYPAMKDSGVPWLGEVPTYWEVRRLKSWLDVNEFVLSEDTDPEYTFEYLDIGSVATGRLTAKPERIRFGNSPSRARRVVRPGDTIVSTVRTYLKAVWHAEHPGDDLVASTGFAVLTPRRGAFPRFVSYFCQSDPFTNRVTAEAVGIAYPAIAETRLGTFEVCIPPYHEQAAIVRFLDHADRRIRRYIRAKQKLIALLEEQKQAIIHQAVTGQLDVRTGKPYQAYKSSGVEWFPEVPDHWNVLPMRRVIYSAVDGPHFSPTYLDTGIPFLSARNVKSDAWSLEDAKYISEEDYDEFNRRVKPVRGDVLYTKGGTTGVARVVDLTFPFQVWVHIAVLKVNKNAIDPGFLAAALNSTRCYEQSQLFTRGATNQDLGLGRMKGIELPVPPALAEQQTIVGYLQTGLGQVLEAISATHREIGLFREYRTRLIADVVTGKLDVRAAAARLPDEVEELEPLDEADALIDGEDEPTDALATAP